jgi:hypothetical protein
MFLYNLIAPLAFIAIFSLPAMLLEVQLLAIGLDGMTPKVLLVTAIIGAVSAISAFIIEEFDL